MLQYYSDSILNRDCIIIIWETKENGKRKKSNFGNSSTIYSCDDGNSNSSRLRKEHTLKPGYFCLHYRCKKADFNGLNVVEISGGMGVTARINNTGTAEATNIPWEIYFCSGRVFIGGFTEGTINVPAGGETTISSGLVFGIGPGSITVTAGGASKIVRCFILGPFILGIGPYP